MISSKAASDVLIKVVKKCDAEKLVRVVSQGFMSEPILRYTDTTLKEHEKFVELLMDNILEDGTSLIAETKEGIVAGGSIAFDFSSTPSQDFLDYFFNHRHFRKTIINNTESTYSRYHGFEHGTLPRGHSVYLFMLATSPNFRNQGLGTKLRSWGLDHYKTKNYKYAMTEATSLFTRKICFKFGFQTIMTVPYSSLFPEGSIYSKSVEDGHDAMHLMVKKL